MFEQGLAQLAGQVQAGEVRATPLQAVHDAQDLGVVTEAAVALHQGVQCPLAAMTEGGVSQIVRQRQGLAQSLVQAEGRPQAAPDLRDLEAVGEARTVVVALGVDEDLCLVHQAPKGRAVHDAVPVTLEDGPQGIEALRVAPTSGSV